MKKLSLAIFFLAVSTSMSGCGKDSDKVEATLIPTVTSTIENGQIPMDAVVLTVGDTSITYGDALLYILQVVNQYEPSFGEGLWGFQVDENSTFEDMAKDEIINQLSQLSIIASEAEKLEISLSGDEKDEINDSVRDYLSKITEKDQKKYNITEDMVYQVVADNYLAEKVFAIVTNKVNTDISDDEAKQMVVQQLVVLTNGTDKLGTKVSKSEEEKKAAKTKASNLLKEAKKAKDFASFASSNSDLDQVEYTLGKGDNKEIEDVAFALEDGQISKVIETSYGYVILRCVDHFDEEATAAKKEEIIETEQNNIFQEQFLSWSKHYSITVNSKVWDKISMADYENE